MAVGMIRIAQPDDLERVVQLLADDDHGRSREQLAEMAVYKDSFAELSRDPHNLLAVAVNGSGRLSDACR